MGCGQGCVLCWSPRKESAPASAPPTSRRHTVGVSASGVITVTGGKLTTYRKMAEDTVDAVVEALGRRKVPCLTKDLRLRGAGPVRRPAARTGSDSVDATPTPTPAADARTGEAAAIAAHLAGRYGSETPVVLSLTDDQPDLLDALVPGLHYRKVEALYAVREEMACTVDDVLDRRTRASLRDARGRCGRNRGRAHRTGVGMGRRSRPA